LLFFVTYKYLAIVKINVKLTLTLADVFLRGLAIPYDPIVIPCSDNTAALAQKITRPIAVLQVDTENACLLTHRNYIQVSLHRRRHDVLKTDSLRRKISQN